MSATVINPSNPELMRAFLASVLLVCHGIPAGAAERPNILWITSEDNAAHWLGCYGNQQASTPRLDRLAGEGIRFTRAYSNAPVCAVARSTILMGAYATTMGTQHMRSRHPISPGFKPYVTLLRESGYYCTNNAKTDYNFRGKDEALWDECSGKAHYRNRRPGQPFMAVFNLTVTHESQLFPVNVERNRRKNVIPREPRVPSDRIQLPPSQPDLPEMRADAAIYHDCVTAMDKEVGQLLDELAANGLADNTIVFYYSDHGGAMARGKRYLEDTGVRVPMLIRVPEKFRHLSPWPAGSTVDEPVAFVDLAPTLLSLLGIDAPPSMQGRAFLGSRRGAPRDVEFLFGDRFDQTPGMRRGITDGKYKYIRCFSPNQPGAPYSEYALGQPSWRAWKEAAEAGRLGGYHRELWQSPQPVESLFDLGQDPWETRNLAMDPAYAQRLAGMRARLRDIMVATKDTGVVPESMWQENASAGSVHALVRADGFDHASLVDLAFDATSPGQELADSIEPALGSTCAVRRYWAATACRLQGKSATLPVEKLRKLANDQSATVRKAATDAIDAFRD